MGGITGKDSNISLYINLNKQFYVAGQYVDGQIYLDAKTDRQYISLSIRLEGEQYVFWTETHHQNDLSHTDFYSNKYKNYDTQFMISDFHGTIKKGQYVFPFRFLLPAMMSGSFYESSSCYIKYILKAVLNHPSSDRENQQYEMFLNILQPPRIPLGPTSLGNTVNSKCCGCCCGCKDYGDISVALECSNNFVRSGDTIQVKGIIDNSKGKVKVEEAIVTFEQSVFMIASTSRTLYNKEKSFVFHRMKQVVNPGQMQQFSFTAQIPNQIVDCTAIGRIVSRYFTLHLDTSYGCCTNTSQTYLHLIVHSRSPLFVEKKKVNAPPGWNPIQCQPVLNQNMKPFSYSPLPLIPFLNMPGNQNVRMNVNFEKQMNNIQQNIGYDLNKQVEFHHHDGHQYNYQPKYYDQNMFTHQQKMQQGYVPYFSNRSDEHL